SLVLLPALWRRRVVSEWALFAVFNVLLLGAFLACLLLVGQPRPGEPDLRGFMADYWRGGLPPPQWGPGPPLPPPPPPPHKVRPPRRRRARRQRRDARSVRPRRRVVLAPAAALAARAVPGPLRPAPARRPAAPLPLRRQRPAGAAPGAGDLPPGGRGAGAPAGGPAAGPGGSRRTALSVRRRRGGRRLRSPVPRPAGPPGARAVPRDGPSRRQRRAPGGRAAARGGGADAALAPGSPGAGRGVGR